MVTKRFIEKMGREIPMLGFGCMRFPEKDGKIDEAAAMEMIDYAVSHGVNYFDTAVMYHNGLSEEFCGRALKKYPRESITIATKMATWDFKSRKDMEDMFQRSLDRLQTDYIDYYLIHALDKNTWQIALRFGAYEFCKEMQAAGKIKKIGFSFHEHPTFLQAIIPAKEFDFAQIQLNYFDWTEQGAHEQYEYLTAHNIPIIAMEPVRGGGLANFSQGRIKNILEETVPGQSAASLAVRYCASLPNCAVVLSGMSSMEQVQDNIKTIENFTELSDKEYSAILKINAAMRELNPIGCTKCNYCDICPQSLPIPQIFEGYNKFVATDDASLLDPQNAATCIDCGKCKEKCPQKIDIPNRLRDIVAKAE